ncbi:hypothetical protein GPECTOR_34g694 [Gonium pectorale]|uniref:Uncharacterized protein n=1 Tax=Gonium pectorale TaxID=33097 RepID=A0A150GD74_GONPE|nr:hypothetical protein GPECTOR_34g694 [Gonium pectorale]|eukprot:KXZ47535.1 hypothetical protein GPECTOR_34g694 [Gonium pectorale]
MDDLEQEWAERQQRPQDPAWDACNKPDPRGEAVSAILKGFKDRDINKLVFASIQQIDTDEYVPMPEEDRVAQYVGEYRLDYKLGPKDYNFCAGKANGKVERWVCPTAYGSEEDWPELCKKWRVVREVEVDLAEYISFLFDDPQPGGSEYNACFDKKFPDAGRFRTTVGKQAICAQLFAATVLQSFHKFLTFVRWSEYGKCTLMHSKYGICERRGQAAGGDDGEDDGYDDDSEGEGEDAYAEDAERELHLGPSAKRPRTEAGA